MRLLRSNSYAVLPWKNGLGTSRIIASHPPGAGYDALDWQVATTGITASCPFSSLAGFDRQFMLLEGEGVELHCVGPDGDPDIRRRIDDPLRPFAFRGDWRTDCTLIGAPVRVFNVMTRRGCYSAQVSISTGGQPLALEKRAVETLIVFVAEGAIRVEGRSVSLAANDAIIVDGAEPERCALSGTSARMVIVRIAPH